MSTSDVDGLFRAAGRVLYVIQQHDFSGAETFAAPVMRADPDPLLACPPGSRTEQFAQGLGIKTAPLPFRSLRHSGGRVELLRSLLRGLIGARDLRRVLRAHPERHVIYCTSLRPGLLAALARAGLGRRTLWVVTDFLPPGILGRLVRLVALLGCDSAAATSETVAADFVGRSRLLRARTVVVYPGVDLARFAGSTVDPASRRAAVIGGISPTKRTDLAIEIARRVGEQVPEFELNVVGRAQYRDEDFALERDLKRVVADDRALRDRVRFVGWKPSVADSLHDCALVLHCRPDEPFGIVMVEAMAAGRPVVAPAAAGAAEIVRDGITGLLYRPGDTDDAAAKVVRLLEDPDARRRMGEAGRARVVSEFLVGAQVRAFERLLASLNGPATRRLASPAR